MMLNSAAIASIVDGARRGTVHLEHRHAGVEVQPCRRIAAAPHHAAGRSQPAQYTTRRWVSIILDELELPRPRPPPPPGLRAWRAPGVRLTDATRLEPSHLAPRVPRSERRPSRRSAALGNPASLTRSAALITSPPSRLPGRRVNLPSRSTLETSRPGVAQVAGRVRVRRPSPARGADAGPPLAPADPLPGLVRASQYGFAASRPRKLEQQTVRVAAPHDRTLHRDPATRARRQSPCRYSPRDVLRPSRTPRGAGPSRRTPTRPRRHEPTSVSFTGLGVVDADRTWIGSVKSFSRVACSSVIRSASASASTAYSRMQGRCCTKRHHTPHAGGFVSRSLAASNALAESRRSSRVRSRNTSRPQPRSHLRQVIPQQPAPCRREGQARGLVWGRVASSIRRQFGRA